ncbi:MAG: PHP domain-containing protein [Candidatus Aenigmatarchaeota archaeon]|nr:MAG: PHP domain-containing protein [Candidatus Aenigmarchaeota archaeon]
MRANLHVHTTISDGKNGPEEVVRIAKAGNVDVIAITDHDATEGIGRAVNAGHNLGIYVIPGIEVSASHLGESVHILGYFVDTEAGGFTDFIESQRRNRNEVLANRIAKVNGHLGTDLTLEGVAGDSLTPTKAHLGDAIVARGFATDVRDAIEKYLSKGTPCYVQSERDPAPQEAVRIIHDAGGLAVWAHPLYPSKIKEFDHAELFAELIDAGLDGVERHFDYEDKTPEIPQALLKTFEELASQNGLLSTGGSDYHGYWKRAKIDQTVVGDDVVNALLGRKRKSDMRCLNNPPA